LDGAGRNIGARCDQALRKAPAQDGPRSLQALDRAFAVLDLFGADRPEWGTSEVARAAGLPVPTAHRILTALTGRRYLARDEQTRRFRLGPAALDLGDRARAMVDLRQVALPVLRRLARETDETALLTVPSGERDRSVCLERVESSQPLRLSVEPGRRLPLHAGASQKALLAFLAEDEIERVVTGPLERVCRATITDAVVLRANLAEARVRGWALSFEETNVGVWGVAVPLLDDDGLAVAALGLAGPSARFSHEEIGDHVERLGDGAVEMAAPLALDVPKLAWP
jgi:DNA-binding IclR family transcriptional regulator